MATVHIFMRALGATVPVEQSEAKNLCLETHKQAHLPLNHPSRIDTCRNKSSQSTDTNSPVNSFLRCLLLKKTLEKKEKISHHGDGDRWEEAAYCRALIAGPNRTIN